MKKYLFSKGMKFILLTLAACMIIFFIVADYYHSEKDIFIEGNIVFRQTRIERDITITATPEEEELIRRWLTTLSSDEQTLTPVWGHNQIVVMGEKSSVGFVLAGDEIWVFPSVAGRDTLSHMYIAHSSDAELTQKVEKLCDDIWKNIN